MKMFLTPNTMLKIVLLFLISTLLVSCNIKTEDPAQDSLDQTASAQELSRKTKASTQNDSDQTTIFQELGGKTAAETLSNRDQLAIPQEFLGAWELIDSNAEMRSLGSIELSTLGLTQGVIEILADGTVVHFNKSAGNDVAINKLIILNKDILVFQRAESGLFFYYEVDGDQLRLSFGDEYNLYGRMSSN